MMQALRGHGAPLLSIVPDDIDTWCPAYRPAGDNQRAAFCAGMVSSLAWHESTHREAAVGGSSLWFGLVQIAPSTARLYQCNARSDQAPLDGAFNLRCRLRIMASTVSRGMAADWGPFHSRTKREDMRDWVNAQVSARSRIGPCSAQERFEQAALVATEGSDQCVANRNAAISCLFDQGQRLWHRLGWQHNLSTVGHHQREILWIFGLDHHQMCDTVKRIGPLSIAIKDMQHLP
jgi:hypothetical protein